MGRCLLFVASVLVIVPLVPPALGGGAADQPAAADPVALLKVILAKIQAQGTAARVTNFVSPHKWVKRQYHPSNLSYDVEKTASLVSPYLATVRWASSSRLSTEFPTQAEADRAALPAARPGGASMTHWARLAFQEGRWVVKDVGFEVAGIEKRHSTLSDPRDPIEDWWRAFGGEPVIDPRAEAENRARAEAYQAEQREEAARAQAEAAARRKPQGQPAAAPQGKSRPRPARPRPTRQADPPKQSPPKQPPPAEFRTWTEAATARTISAKFRGLANGVLRLELPNGSTVSVPLERLSQDDRDYLKSRSR